MKKECPSSNSVLDDFNTGKSHPDAWASTYNKVSKEPLKPYQSIRRGRVLIVEPESGYWEIVSESLKEKRIKTLHNRVKELGVRPPDPSTYDSDYYPLECVLYLTNKCNLSCSYCYSTTARNADWRDFDRVLLKKAIRMLFNEPRRQSLCFLLFGGESLVAFPLMKEIVAYVHEVNRFFGKKVSFRMQTNGTLISDSVVSFLKENNVQIGISLDGPEHIHDKNRRTLGGKPSYKSIMRGVELLQKNDIPFSVISTVCRPEDMVPTFEYFMKMKFTRRVKISPMLPEGMGKKTSVGEFLDYSRNWGRANLEAAHKLIEFNKGSSYKLREDNIFAMVTHLVRDHRPDICLRTPCGAAYGMIEFHPDGSLVTCDKTLYSEELGVVANISELDESVSLLDLLDQSPLIESIRNRTVDTIPKCSHCTVKRHCGGACTLGSYDFFKDFHREDVMCEYRRFMFEELMWLLGKDPVNALLLAAPDSII